ncbi:MAG: asparaginase [Longimicrobiales bacterium]
MKREAKGAKTAPTTTCLAVLSLLLCPLRGSADQLPRVHVIATGGTIASSAAGAVGVDQLVAGVPALTDVAEVSFEQVLRVGSSRITTQDWLALAESIDRSFSADPELAGVVVTHGTDSMEETAYFLDLVVQSDRPVVVTGAMRTADAVGADGPANLLAAVRVAVSDESRGRGTLVVMNDEIHLARDVVKTNTLAVHAFRSPMVGAVGEVGAGVLFRRGRDSRPERFSFQGVTELPRVEVDYSFVGSEGVGLMTARHHGARGVVIAAFGSGRVAGAQADQITEALREGIIVVMSSRVGAGRVQDEYAGALGAEGLSVLYADNLNPQKARVLLMVALTRTQEPAVLAEIFERY